MLEKFTPEEIEQIKKELGIRDRMCHKQIVLREQQDRLEKLFPRKAYSCEGIGLYCTKEIIDAITMLTDHCLNNYKQTDRTTVRHHGQRYVRHCNIPDDMEAEYLRVYTEFVDLMEKNNVPWQEVQEFIEMKKQPENEQTST